MSKSTEELMFGAENTALVVKAVQQAVARAEAAGLPRAYKRLPPEAAQCLEFQEPVSQAGQDQA